MRYMSFIKSSETAGPPPSELMTAIAGFGEEATKAGVLVEQGGLLPSALGAKVRLSNGKLSVTDGPFTEAKEIVGGYAVFDVKTREEAVDWTRRFMELHKQHWPGWEGETEVRQVMQFSA